MTTLDQVFLALMCLWAICSVVLLFAAALTPLWLWLGRHRDCMSPAPSAPETAARYGTGGTWIS